MSFISIQFVLFLALIFTIYYLPWFSRHQVSILVFASFIFYGSDQWRLIPLLLISSAFTYFMMVKAIENRKWALAVGVTANLAILGFFKYKFLFFAQGHPPKLGIEVVDYLLELPLPIGISFFVFHNISLIVDYKKEGHHRPQPSMMNVLIYILFFPQLVSGPITRSISFLPQITTKKISEVAFKQAIKLIIFGLFFKLFVANNLAQVTVKMAPEFRNQLGCADKVLLIYTYSAQIYADFAGYSTMALGLALLFGYRLPVNFNMPYISASFSEFWTRWHISLSSWLRTYLYIPLGGNRTGSVRTYINLLIVMGLGGLWHGAAISYLIWGSLHGLFLAIERGLKDLLMKFNFYHLLQFKSAKVFYQFFVFSAVSYAWIFFRFENFNQAWTYLIEIVKNPMHFTQHKDFYLLTLIYASPVLFQHFFRDKVNLSQKPLIEILGYGMLLWLAIVERGADTQFIYFRF